MKKLTIKTGSEKDFFASGRRLAKSVDQGKTIKEERIISFEDPVDMLHFITSSRWALFRANNEASESITDMRNDCIGGAVKRDHDEWG